MGGAHFVNNLHLVERGSWVVAQLAVHLLRLGALLSRIWRHLLEGLNGTFTGCFEGLGGPQGSDTALGG